MTTTSNHRVLIVEDDVSTREELEALLRTFHFDVVSCGDKQTALHHLDMTPFCMALVDLQIHEKPGALRPLEVHGRSLIREIRTVYPERHGIGHRFPILVVSGYAREAPEAVEVMREGASQIVWKSAHGGLAAELSRTIHEGFRAAGRHDHADCSLTPLELSIPGDREGRKTRVMLGARSALLADRHLRVLLYLVRAKLMGTSVHNSDMGFTGAGGNRIPSEINNELKSIYPAGTEAIVENHYHGNYSLIDAVTIGDIDYEALVAIDDHTITALAGEIQELSSPSAGNS